MAIIGFAESSVLSQMMLLAALQLPHFVRMSRMPHFDGVTPRTSDHFWIFGVETIRNSARRQAAIHVAR